VDRTAYIRRGEVSAPEARYVVGVDAGGTKTHAAVATLDGQVVSLVEAGPGNFQAVGVQAATQNTKKAVDGALSAAGITHDDLAWSAFAVAGADRHKDFITIADYLETIVPGHVLTNDTLAALWGASRDGSGVALIVGTGANTIGVNEKGDVAKVGGFGPFSGDMGYGEDLVLRALTQAWKARDGREKPTILDDMLCAAIGIEKIEDLAEFYFADSYNPPALGQYAPVVFKAANKGDAVALELIDTIAKHLAFNVTTALRRLGYKKSDAPLVGMGGSLVQKPRPALLRNGITQYLQKKYPDARVKPMKVEPVVGALIIALNDVAGKPPTAALRKRLERSITDLEPHGV